MADDGQIRIGLSVDTSGLSEAESQAQKSATEIAAAYDKVAAASLEAANVQSRHRDILKQYSSGAMDAATSTKLLSQNLSENAAAAAILAEAKRNLTQATNAEAEAEALAAAATDVDTEAVVTNADAHHAMVSEVAAASGAIRVFEGAMPIRAVERFAVNVLGLGPLLQAAFPVIGAIALTEMIVKMGEELYKAFDLGGERARKMDQDIRNVDQSFRTLLDSTNLEIDRLQDADAKLEKKPNPNGMKLALDEALVSADRLDSKLDELINKEMTGLKSMAASMPQQALGIGSGTKYEETMLSEHQRHLSEQISTQSQLNESTRYGVSLQTRLNELSAMTPQGGPGKWRQAPDNSGWREYFDVASNGWKRVGVEASSNMKNEVDATQELLIWQAKEQATIKATIDLEGEQKHHEGVAEKTRLSKEDASAESKAARAKLEAFKEENAALQGAFENEGPFRVAEGAKGGVGQAAAEAGFWQSKLGAFKQGSAEYLEVEKAFNAARKAEEYAMAASLGEAWKEEFGSQIRAEKEADEADRIVAEAWTRRHEQKMRQLEEETAATERAASRKEQAAIRDIEFQEKLGRLNPKKAAQKEIEAINLEEKTKADALQAELDEVAPYINKEESKAPPPPKAPRELLTEPALEPEQEMPARPSKLPVAVSASIPAPSPAPPPAISPAALPAVASAPAPSQISAPAPAPIVSRMAEAAIRQSAPPPTVTPVRPALAPETAVPTLVPKLPVAAAEAGIVRSVPSPAAIVSQSAQIVPPQAATAPAVAALPATPALPSTQPPPSATAAPVAQEASAKAAESAAPSPIPAAAPHLDLSPAASAAIASAESKTVPTSEPAQAVESPEPKAQVAAVNAERAPGLAAIQETSHAERAGLEASQPYAKGPEAKAPASAAVSDKETRSLATSTETASKISVSQTSDQVQSSSLNQKQEELHGLQDLESRTTQIKEEATDRRIRLSKQEELSVSNTEKAIKSASVSVQHSDTSGAPRQITKSESARFQQQAESTAQHEDQGASPAATQGKIDPNISEANVTKYQEIQKRITEIQQQAADKRELIVEQETLREIASYQKSMAQISSAIVAGTNRWMTSHQSFENSMIESGKRLTVSFIDDIEKQGLKWVAHEALLTTVHLAGLATRKGADAMSNAQMVAELAADLGRWVTHELAKVGIHIGANSAKVASDAATAAAAQTIQTTAAAAATTAKVAASAAQIAANAVVAQSEAGVAAATAAAEAAVGGPLAAAAAGAIMLGVMEPFVAAASMEHGGVVPGRTGEAVPILAHANEAVLPAPLTAMLTTAAGNGSGVGNAGHSFTSVSNIHATVLDPRGLEAFADRTRDMHGRQMNKFARQANATM